jgi:MbtH protein
MNDFTIDGDRFQVLVNHEGQHSLWPAAQRPPAGWTQAGQFGTKAECIAYVEAHWRDMRPRSLQQSMQSDTPTPSASSPRGES